MRVALLSFATLRQGLYNLRDSCSSNSSLCRFSAWPACLPVGSPTPHNPKRVRPCRGAYLARIQCRKLDSAYFHGPLEMTVIGPPLAHPPLIIRTTWDNSVKLSLIQMIIIRRHIRKEPPNAAPVTATDQLPTARKGCRAQ